MARKTFLYSAVLLGLGIVIGWWSRGKLASGENKRLDSGAPVAQKANVAVTETAPVRASTKEEERHKTDDAMAQRLEALAWMKKNVQGKINLRVVTFNRLDNDFIKLFGLTETEAATLNEKLAETRSHLDQLAIDSATSRMDVENNSFSVHVAPFPTEGGQVRDELFQSFVDVLGQDRYDAMNALTGQAIDNDFRQFGLADVTYEINLVSTQTSTGQSVYQVKETNLFPESFTTTGNSSLPASGIRDLFPVLSHFIPPNALGTPK